MSERPASICRTLVLHASALHIGYIGCYGNDEVVTPNLDRLAEEGVVFDWHIADQPRIGQSSLPSAWLESKQARHLDLRSLRWDNRLAKKVVTQMGAWLRGDEPLCWIDLPSLAPPWQVPEDILTDNFPDAEDEDGLSPWLDPPTGPADHDETASLRLQITYAAAVADFDARIGQIIEHLRERDALDSTMIVVTANAGLALGEHGYVGEHRAWLHEEIVHVPLIVRMPAAQDAGLRIAALTQPADVLAMIAEAAGLPAPSEGQSALPLIRGEVEQLHNIACSRLVIGDSEELAARTLEWHLVVPVTTPRDDPPRPSQLFVKPDDRWEVNDVRQQHLDLAEELEARLREQSARHVGKMFQREH